MNVLAKFVKRTAIGFITVSSLITPASHAAQISISPASGIVNLGDLVTVSLGASGLETLNLSVFDFDIKYDNTILEYVTHSLSDNLGVNDIDALDLSMPAGTGVVNLAQTSLLDGNDPFFDTQANAFSLGTLIFKAVGIGKSDLMINIKEFGDEFANPISASVVNGSVSSVPEPATGVLMVAGIFGLFMLYRKNSKSII